MTKHHDAIWVVIDRLTKATHFLALKITFIVNQLEDLYIKEVGRLRGILLIIVSYCDTKFASKFWHEFQIEMGTKLCFSTACHPQ